MAIITFVSWPGNLSSHNREEFLRRFQFNQIELPFGYYPFYSMLTNDTEIIFSTGILSSVHNVRLWQPDSIVCVEWKSSKEEGARRLQANGKHLSISIFLSRLPQRDDDEKKNEQSHDDSRIHMFVACILAIIVQLITYLCTSLCNCLFYLYCMCCCHFSRALLSHLFTHFNS